MVWNGATTRLIMPPEFAYTLAASRPPHSAWIARSTVCAGRPCARCRFCLWYLCGGKPYRCAHCDEPGCVERLTEHFRKPKTRDEAAANLVPAPAGDNRAAGAITARSREDELEQLASPASP